MAYRFKKQIFGFLDLIRFSKVVDVRRAKLAEGSAAPLPNDYRVNLTARILHPGNRKAVLTDIIKESADTKTYVFDLGVKMLFRAGQYVTLSAKVGDSYVSRPYAVSSSPYTALKEGKVALTVKKAGYFSDWLFDNAEIGAEFAVNGPSGYFHYESLKDRPLIVGIAGGSAITPFYSMAQALAEGSEDFRLVLFYGARTAEDILFKDKLDALTSDKFKVVYVLSDEENTAYEHGFVTADLIRKYVDEEFTAMMCGPDAMYSFLVKELATLGVSGKFVKKEANGAGVRDVKPAVYKLTVHIRDEVYEIPANAEETLLVAMERAGLHVPAMCRAGGCGYCHSKLVKGKFSIAGDDKRRLADAKFSYIHPCCSYPDSDIELIVPPQNVK